MEENQKETLQKFKLPKSLTTVTKASKLLALFLFVMLPFIGFYLGISYQINSQKTHSKSTTQISQPTTQPNPNCTGTAKISHLWDKNSERSSANIYLFALLKGWGSNKNVYFEVAIQNRSLNGLNISPSDFSLLDESGNKLGEAIINRSESPFIPDKGYIDPQRQIIGHITIANVPDFPNTNDPNPEKTNFILRFQPQIEGVVPIDYPIKLEFPPSGGTSI
jgi:hypothetical protein